MAVYKNYNQEQLDNQFNTRLKVPDYAAYFSRWEILSGQTREQYKNFSDIPYGEDPDERLDIYPATKEGASTLIFIHGGYWHLLDKAMFHFLAPPFLKYNINIVFINYRMAPAASLDQIVSSSRKAIHWLKDHIKDYGGDPSRFYLLGHSAGGHLATMLLAEEKSTFLKGAISLSGLFLLEPVMLSYLNEVLGMDPETAIRNSPSLLKQLNDCPLLLVTGEDETAEFIDQSDELSQIWQSQKKPIQRLSIKGKNHYSILEAIIEKDSLLKAAILHLILNEEVDQEFLNK